MSCRKETTHQIPPRICIFCGLEEDKAPINHDQNECIHNFGDSKEEREENYYNV